MRSQLPYELPREVLKNATAQMAAITNERLFNDSQYQKLREAWVAGKFGVGYAQCVGPCEVAVNETSHRTDSDFFLRKEDREFAFQIAEVQVPGRRRGDEQRGIANGSVTTIPYEPSRGRIEGPTWIRDAVARKAEKNYANSTRLNLVIYANFSAEGLNHAEVEHAAHSYSKSFMSVWVLSNYFLGTLFTSAELGAVNGWGIISVPFEP